MIPGSTYGTYYWLLQRAYEVFDEQQAKRNRDDRERLKTQEYSQSNDLVRTAAAKGKKKGGGKGKNGKSDPHRDVRGSPSVATAATVTTVSYVSRS